MGWTLPELIQALEEEECARIGHDMASTASLRYCRRCGKSWPR